MWNIWGPSIARDTTSSTHPAHFSHLAGQRTRSRVPYVRRVKMCALTKMWTLNCLVPQAAGSCLAAAAADVVFSFLLLSFFCPNNEREEHFKAQLSGAARWMPLPPPPLCRRQIAQAILDLARDGWIARGVFSQRAEASDRDEHGDKSRVMAFLLRYLHWISSGESRIQSNPSRSSWMLIWFPYKKNNKQKAFGKTASF